MIIMVIHNIAFFFFTILDVRGKNSLHLAVSNGFLEMVKYLIEKGSDVHVIDKYNRSCLHWAAMNKHYDVVKELLNAGQCQFILYIIVLIKKTKFLCLYKLFHALFGRLLFS